MSEMVERVELAALSELRRQAEGGDPFVDDSEGAGSVLVDGRIDLRATLRAAIDAICEPTEAMAEAGSEVIVSHGWSNAGELIDADSAADVWRAMIAVLLTRRGPSAPSADPSGPPGPPSRAAPATPASPARGASRQ